MTNPLTGYVRLSNERTISETCLRLPAYVLTDAMRLTDRLHEAQQHGGRLSKIVSSATWTDIYAPKAVDEGGCVGKTQFIRQCLQAVAYMAALSRIDPSNRVKTFGTPDNPNGTWISAQQARACAILLFGESFVTEAEGRGPALTPDGPPAPYSLQVTERMEALTDLSITDTRPTGLTTVRMTLPHQLIWDLRVHEQLEGMESRGRPGHPPKTDLLPRLLAAIHLWYWPTALPYVKVVRTAAHRSRYVVKGER